MLRTVLIVFGWMIPFVSVLLALTQIYAGIQLQSIGDARQPELWITVVRSIAYGIQNLALSPLCFFGAHMLEKQGKLSE
ncbi:hypothetical protein GCM10011309_22180 [Litorimonas cladophorae]|uniref:Uncharacterized protein n=1 Tax=Litorimonas cladophorae TaxID=1220491 RepID=A0A918KQ25_9PROT|nr:hypothetical protein [Litorimonas cladophorae]GGX71540.1 hypothetical protein GCM10011309_22180 [Litorimonas cladophorae]